MGDTISECCHAEIKWHYPRASFYSLSPKDPIPYCTACEAYYPEEIEPEEAADEQA